MNRLFTRALTTAEGGTFRRNEYELPDAEPPHRRNRATCGKYEGTALANVAAVPEISRFFGIVIGMFYSEHGTPHFHARYGDSRATIDIDTGRVAGDLPPRALSFVLEWRALHVAELNENWRSARAGNPLAPVPPLE